MEVDIMNRILTNALLDIETFQKEHPDDISDMVFQLEALKAHMKWIKNAWLEPTLEDLESMS